MNRVFVLGSTKQPLMPCHPARARELLQKGKAAVYRMQPFTIILKFRAEGVLQNIEFNEMLDEEFLPEPANVQRPVYAWAET